MTRKPPKGKSLADKCPELSKEWHSTKNGNLTPLDVTYGSANKVWWKCPVGEDHEWISTVNNRSRGQGCPVCVGQKTVLSNCLATVNPEIASEWHLSKNGDLTPYDVTPFSTKSVWWQCPKGDDHDWTSSIDNRSKGQGCPVCSNKKAVLSNCLATINPEIAKEWHPSKNGDLTPYNLLPQSNKKVWWKCPKGEDHEWKVAVAHRTNARNCPICSGRKTVNSNSLETLYPSLALEWHPTKNGNLKPSHFTAFSHKRISWRCINNINHEWNAIISSRTNGRGCPMCAEYGFNPEIPAILYYLKVMGGIAYKIGITNRTVEERLRKDVAKIEIIKIWAFEKGVEAFKKEQSIISEHIDKKYLGPNLLKDGNSELFTEDVLGLDI